MPTPAEIESQVRAIVARQLKGVTEADLSLEKSFVDDLKADSLDMVELVMAMEDRFGFEIPEDEVDKIRTVGDAVRYIGERLG
jgi:acyl carrier protein